jgi:hypothetical protein
MTIPNRQAEDVSDNKLWKWLQERVEEGRGAIELAMTEEGNLGLFRNDSEMAWAIGSSMRSAVMNAMVKYPNGRDYERSVKDQTAHNSNPAQH